MNTETERQGFEAWYAPRLATEVGESLERHLDSYWWKAVAEAWEVWQAARRTPVVAHTSTEQPEALKLVYELGANRIKVQPTETERLRFEQWMAGHCWQVGGVWDGETYVSATENGDYLDPQAMHTRQLFAAWRDCAALRDQLEASQAQRLPLTPDAKADRCEAWLQRQGATNIVDAFEAGFSDAEHAHGITQEKQ